jgi:protein involved in temperature-dependent protein secretion
MNTDQQIEKGDFEGALAELRRATAQGSPDPAQLLSQFNMEVRLQEFDAAEATMQRLCAAAPQVAPVMGALGLAARAERMATERLVNPTLATKRATPGLPPPHALAYVKMAALHAQRDYAGAALALAEAKAATPRTSGTLTRKDGQMQRFEAIADSDELTGPTLTCYEGQNLLDIAFSELHSVSFAAPQTSFDVMWPRAEVVTVTGQRLLVRVPAFYPGTGREKGPIRTGQMTTWARDKGYAEGKGQRDLAVTMADGGSVMMGLLRIGALTFDNPMRAAFAPNAMTAKPWTPIQKGVATVAFILAFILVLRPSLLLSFGDNPRIPAIGIGLGICACVGWVASERSTKTAAGIAVAVTFVVTTLRWIL